MKDIVILGAGTAGTLTAAKLARSLDAREWRITVVDRDDRHLYQPGLLFVPFGVYGERHLFRPRSRFVPRGVELVLDEIEAIDPPSKRVRLRGGRTLRWDFLVIATGSRIVPDETEGMLGPGWRTNTFDFYTPEGALALAAALRRWKGGRLLVNLVEMPIKCPVAPLEFLLLADWYFTRDGRRDDVELVYATPLTGAFTKQACSDVLGGMLEQRGIRIEPQFNAGEIDGEQRMVRSFDGTGLAYDLLVTVPVHRGSEAIARSGIGDELDFIPTDRHTLRAVEWENVFVMGDATDLPASKAGSVAHFQGDVVHDNLRRAMAGRALEPGFDGHANCFIESGFGRAIMIDFNYDVEPMPGTFPLPGIGPFTLLAESRINHWGKLGFRWFYWNVLLRGWRLPIGHRMSMVGKRPLPVAAAPESELVEA